MMICTRNNLAGNQYSIRGNLKKLFDKFIDKGQCTISLLNPPTDILISNADPLKLKAFMKTLKRIIMAKSQFELEILSLTSEGLNPASAKEISKLREKLVITEKKDYPILTSFPSTLKNLKIIGIKLKLFDKRILTLSHLVVLELTENCISSIPDSFESLSNLKELNLSKNEINILPMKFFHCPTMKSLLLLNLSGNRLKFLPNAISNLCTLKTLNIANNDLSNISLTLGKMTQLRRLELKGNPNLTVLPGCIPRLKLEFLSLGPECLTGSNDESEGLKLHDSSNEIPTLLDICVAKCSSLQLETKLDESMIPVNILLSMNTLQRCECGNFCHESSHAKGITKANPNRIATTFVSETNHIPSQTFVRCATLFCSTQCLDKYKQQPLNYR